MALATVKKEPQKKTMLGKRHSREEDITSVPKKKKVSTREDIKFPSQLDEKDVSPFGSFFPQTLVPIIFDHTIGKSQSSFPFVYLEGLYDPSIKPLITNSGQRWMERHQTATYEPSRALVSKPPNRSLIDLTKKLFAESTEKKFPSLNQLEEWKQKVITRDSKVLGPASAPLNEANILSYLNRVDEFKIPIHSLVARLIVDETEQVNFSTFFDFFRQSFLSFVGRNKQRFDNSSQKWYLWVPLFLRSGLGSEHWLAIRALFLFKAFKVPLTGTIDEWLHHDSKSTVTDTINVLVFDDAIYSGIHIRASIREFFDNVSKQLQAIPGHFFFHLIVPFATCEGINEIKKLISNEKQNVAFYAIERLQTIEQLYECQKPTISSIPSFEKLLKTKFSKQTCPVRTPFDCS